MNDKLELFCAAFGRSEPWTAARIEFDPPAKRLDPNLDCRRIAVCPLGGSGSYLSAARHRIRPDVHAFFQYPGGICPPAPRRIADLDPWRSTGND